MGKQQTAVIVGGTGNVGGECARRFRAAGYRVWQLSRHAPPPDQGFGAEWRECDVLDSASFRRMLRRISTDTGQLDILVYTAGLPPDTDMPLAAYPLDAWYATWNTYVTGFLVAFQEAIQLMKPHGHFVVIGSAITRLSENTLPPFHAGHYAAAKAALNELCKWGKREAHAQGFLLSRISPGALDVAYHRDAPTERRPKAMVPVPRLVDLIITAINDAKELDLDVIA